MRKKNILIVEDEAILVSTMKLILSSNDYNVITAYNGKQALEKIINQKSNYFDLLITDIFMPELNGSDLLRELNNRDISIPALVVTAYGSKNLLVDLLEISNFDYLDKPFDKNEFLKKVEKIIHKNSINESKAEKAGNELHSNYIRLSSDLEVYKKNFNSLYEQLTSAKNSYEQIIRPKSLNDGKINFQYKIKPLAKMGGDYFDILETPHGYDILIADVAGHDIQSSYHTVLLKAFFYESANLGYNGEAFFKLLNDILNKDTTINRLITATYLSINLEDMTAEFVSAAHPYSIMLAAGSKIPEKICIGGSVIGLLDEVEFDYQKISITKGDKFFLYTDGLINSSYFKDVTIKKEKLNEDGLVNLIARYVDHSLDDMLTKIWDEILCFCRYKPNDDILLLGVEIQ